MNVEDAIDELKSAGANYRCSSLVKVLKSLKFEVTDGAKGNHKVFKHPDIPHFTGGHFDCGHGKSPQVKKFYIGDVRKTLERYKEELEQLK